MPPVRHAALRLKVDILLAHSSRDHIASSMGVDMCCQNKSDWHWLGTYIRTAAVARAGDVKQVGGHLHLTLTMAKQFT